VRVLVIILTWLLIGLSSPCYAWHLTADPQPIWMAFNQGVMWYEVDVDGTVYTHDTQPAAKAVNQGDGTVRLVFSLDWVPFNSGPYSVKVRGVNPKGNGSWTSVVTFIRNIDGLFIGTVGDVPEDSCCLSIVE